MSLFTLCFCAEFLFVNMISRTVSNQSVNAQTMRLVSASSVLFCILFFPRFCKGKWQNPLAMRSDFMSVICLFSMAAMPLCTTLGMGLFAVSDSRRIWKWRILQTLCLIEDNNHIAQLTGVSYMFESASNRKQQFGSYRSHRNRHTFCIYTIAGILC